MPTEEQLQEIHRLAVLGNVAPLPRMSGHGSPGAGWPPPISRGAAGESPDLSAGTPCADAGRSPVPGEYWVRCKTHSNITAQPCISIQRWAAGRPGHHLNNIGGVYNGLGDRQQALTYYQQALAITEEVGDRAGLATTLNNIGGVYNGLGDRQQALTYYQQALAIQEEVGDRAGECDAV